MTIGQYYKVKEVDKNDIPTGIVLAYSKLYGWKRGEIRLSPNKHNVWLYVHENSLPVEFYLELINSDITELHKQLVEVTKERDSLQDYFDGHNCSENVMYP